MLRLVGVGAGHEHAPVAEVSQGVPHLLPVDHPFVAITHGAGAEAGEVGPRTRFAEQLAPALFTREHRPQEAVLLLIGAMGDDGGPRQRHEERGGVLADSARLTHTLFHQSVQVGPHAQAAEPFGEVHPGEAMVVAGTTEGTVVDLLGVDTGQEAGERVLHQGLVGVE